ncbi:HNH endonuclease [Candidatus Pacearchaeota archaeon]|nr:HNH endonuclease [Candidatus Pacearchaeota archaeon]
MICEYGCSQEAKYPPRKGKSKWSCREKYQQCPSVVLKTKQTKPRKPLSDEHKKKLSELAKDRHTDPTSNYNKTSYKLKIGKAVRKKWKEPEYRSKQSLSRRGLKRSTVFKEKQSLRIIGHPAYNKRTIEKITKKYPFFSKVEEMRYNPDNSDEIQVRCKNHKCKNSKEHGGWFTPSHDQFYGRLGALERPLGYEELNFYCSDTCKQECPLYNLRSDPLSIPKEKVYIASEYETWKTKVLELDNHQCQYCGKTAEHVHHIEPQKLKPGYAIDPVNGISVCSDCHYEYGHKNECSTGRLAKIICK